METLIQLWENNPEFLQSKKISQIISFAADGNIFHAETQNQLREYFKTIPSSILIQYVQDCFVKQEGATPFPNSGLVLQDLVNEIGRKLGFYVENGVYKGSKGKIGFDGLWTAKDSHTIIIECKTTDAYRINLSDIHKYQEKLEIEGRVQQGKASILIITGRQDTGDLEAQVRGSKYAWDIRLISIDALIQLLKLEESFSDQTTMYQIYEVLKPKEYTRLDSLIELIFLTSREEDECEHLNDNSTKVNLIDLYGQPNIISSSTNFYDQCIQKINALKNIYLEKKKRVLYATKDMSVGIVLSISKTYEKYAGKNRFWFAYHSYYQTYLSGFANKYIAYGCGSEDLIFLFPLDFIEGIKSSIRTTNRNGKVYWHIDIRGNNDHYYLSLIADNETNSNNMLDITHYRML